ncbi:MAG TPA: carbohydrate ABC transporter permease [Spirochaetia bacterium]|nr:carbohydrate ABC transporter permease [Spirochaetia bacterium]
MVRGNRYGRYILSLITLLICFMFLVPLLQTVSTSLKTNTEIFRVPASLVPLQVSGEHYRHVFVKLKDFFHFFRNSVVVTSVSVLLILMLGSLAAFGLARIDFFGKRFIIFFVSFIVSIPLIITVIPIFMIETALKLKNTNLGLILPYVAVYMPVPLFIMYSSFLKIPSELEESAVIDGCSRFVIYRKIFLPLASSGLVAAGLITFLNCWGEFLFALILTTKRNSTTLPIGIMMINQEEQAWALGPMSAVMVLSIVIPLALYLFLQRYFVKGLLEGSLKG